MRWAILGAGEMDEVDLLAVVKHVVAHVGRQLEEFRVDQDRIAPVLGNGDRARDALPAQADPDDRKSVVRAGPARRAETVKNLRGDDPEAEHSVIRIKGARRRHLDEALLGQPRPQGGAFGGVQIAVLQGVDPGVQVRRVAELVGTVRAVLSKEVLARPDGFPKAATVSRSQRRRVRSGTSESLR
jgi:hypothetical protein